MGTPVKTNQLTMGMCLGASTLTTVQRNNGTLAVSRNIHNGQVGELVRRIVRDNAPLRLGITGRKFRKLITTDTVSEPEAVELAYAHIRERYPQPDSILSAGSESFLLYSLDSRGKIRSVNTGNKCASGTGEFFLQQINRMQLGLEEAMDTASRGKAYDIAGRCSVFSKSDCTHALNKGVKKGRVTAGLCKMMASKMMELLRAARVRRVMVVGGVSQNPVVMEFLKESYPEAFAPDEASYFEALGALLWAEANSPVTESGRELIDLSYNSFAALPDLASGHSRVDFRSSPAAGYRDGDFIIGLDVGSTTTKAVLMQCEDRAIVASEYLRTLGDPVAASRECYRALLRQLPAGSAPRIIGLGVTGSGRQISGLHAGTGQIINEIMAHATAAVFYDPEVDTIFEIGGQDAKYTFLTNAVPTDYAMNEACAAGTGSFLEEACRESFGIETTGIAETALAAKAPPDFSDQCSAFISSDVKTAVQEGASTEDSVAGLVYSVCRNYLNRVKGNRVVGKKIFMQGGVCYNSAVPLAMANLCGRDIVVPPDPGLMGAFGAALEVQGRLEKGLAHREEYDLAQLADREIEGLEPFICAGGPEKCDRKCSVDRYRLGGRIYPFGGACDRFYNLHGSKDRTAGQDLVRFRETRIFPESTRVSEGGDKRSSVSIGIPRSLFTCAAYPLYEGFFSALGFNVIAGEDADPAGMEAAGAPFCFPVLQSHGMAGALLARGVDHLFVPHVSAAHQPADNGVNCTCPFVQGEPYYIRTAFKDALEGKLLTEVLDFRDPAKLRRAFVRIGRRLGCGPGRAGEAFDHSWDAFAHLGRELKDEGRRFLDSLAPEDTALVLFGRPYNALTGTGHMGIPQKFASRGYRIVPYDILPSSELGAPPVEGMYWASGQAILQAAAVVRDHPNLYGVYITNFSCGPDSFVLERFRTTMGRKPFLTLELDAHTADAGVDTRIEAFLDVVAGYRLITTGTPEQDHSTPATTVIKRGDFRIVAGDGSRLPLTDPRVHVLFPSMGDIGTRAIASVMRYMGVQATALRPPRREELELGKGVTSCKECMPFILTAGSLLRYLQARQDPDEVTAYFMPETDGPCRFGQYNHALKEIVRKHRYGNVAMLSLTAENGYAGMPRGFTSRAILAMLIADALDDVQAAIKALATDRDRALAAFDGALERLLKSLATDSRKDLLALLQREMTALAAFGKTRPLSEATRITLTGEIYVRRDAFSRQHLVDKLADQGIVVRVSPVTEWYLYVLEYVSRGYSEQAGVAGRLKALLKRHVVERYERIIQDTVALSGFYARHPVDIRFLMDQGRRLVNPALTGEAILTVSSTLKELGDETHGVISIGPFGCMPSRLAESIINYSLEDEKPAFSRSNRAFWAGNGHRSSLPFLAIETDGNAFPQVVEARLESFLLAAERLKTELSELHPVKDRP